MYTGGVPGPPNLSKSTLASIGQQLREADEQDLQALIPDIAAAVLNVGADQWWIKKDIYKAFEAQGVHITQCHYHSPLPELGQIELLQWDSLRFSVCDQLFDVEEMYRLHQQILPYASELDTLASGNGFCWDNSFYTNYDAVVYYSLCRYKQPARILEVGSGYSTHLAVSAVEKNGSGAITCIEPSPTPKLREVIGAVELIPRGVFHCKSQFSRLSSGDILFIDGSHVSKLGSDVNYLLFEVLPNLPRGVLIHFHDILLPDEYPREWVVNRNWSWNEQYLILAFLMYNSDFKVLMANHSLILERYVELDRDLSFLGLEPLRGSSLWLERT